MYVPCEPQTRQSLSGSSRRNKPSGISKIHIHFARLGTFNHFRATLPRVTPLLPPLPPNTSRVIAGNYRPPPALVAKPIARLFRYIHPLPVFDSPKHQRGNHPNRGSDPPRNRSARPARINGFGRGRGRGRRRGRRVRRRPRRLEPVGRVRRRPLEARLLQECQDGEVVATVRESAVQYEIAWI